jgi:hypothetical protein
VRAQVGPGKGNGRSHGGNQVGNQGGNQGGNKWNQQKQLAGLAEPRRKRNRSSLAANRPPDSDESSGGKAEYKHFAGGCYLKTCF